MREVKIVFSVSQFSILFWKFRMWQGGLSLYGHHKGAEGAGTDMMLQFCLPKSWGNKKWFHKYQKFSVFQSTVLSLQGLILKLH